VLCLRAASMSGVCLNESRATATIYEDPRGSRLHRVDPEHDGEVAHQRYRSPILQVWQKRHLRPRRFGRVGQIGPTQINIRHWITYPRATPNPRRFIEAGPNGNLTELYVSGDSWRSHRGKKTRSIKIGSTGIPPRTSRWLPLST
jgi:hypothetical protein